MKHEKNVRFNFLKKLFQVEVRSYLKKFVAGQLDQPLLIELDPTNRCNYLCPECISVKVKGNLEISPKRLERLIKEFSLAGVKGIIFIGGGEPLLHSSMPKPLRQAYDLKMDVGLTTNGSLINRYINTIAECVSLNRVSVDAASSKMYEVLRPSGLPNPFMRVINNMENLAKIKKGALGYCFLIIQRKNNKEVITNACEIYRAAKIAKDIGCDYFEFKPMVNLHHYLLPFSTEMRRLIKEQYQKCKELENDSFEIVAPRSIEHLSKYDNPIQPKDYETCAVMEFRTLVTPTGIYPCPYMRGRQDKKMGSIDDEPFNKFWESKKRKQAMSLINPKKDCGFYCIRHWSNVVLNTLKDLEDQGVPFLDYIKEVEGIDDKFF